MGRRTKTRKVFKVGQYNLIKMVSRLFLTIFLVLVLASFVSAEATCGDGKCNTMYEDISTCYNDCQFASGVSCDIDAISGGSCLLDGRTFIFSNLNRASCGGLSDISLALDATYNGHTVNMPGFAPQTFIRLIDDVQIAYDMWPCSVATTQQRIYLMGNLDKSKFNNFMSIQTPTLDLKQINTSSFDLLFSFDYKGLKQPRLSLDIKNSETSESNFGSMNGPGATSQPITIYPSSTKPGKYLVDAKLKDNGDTNIISEQTGTIIINECATNQECNDGKFWTKDVCSGNEYKICSNPLNYLVVGAIILVILLVIILIGFIIKRSNSQKTY